MPPVKSNRSAYVGFAPKADIGIGLLLWPVGKTMATVQPMADSSEQDLAALQGVWEQVAFEEGGSLNPPDEYGGSLTTISGSSFRVCASGGALLLEGQFELDASVLPKSVNWIDAIGPDAGKKLPAIYKLEGDHFVFIAADEGAARPTAFRTSLGETIRTFRRRR